MSNPLSVCRALLGVVVIVTVSVLGSGADRGRSPSSPVASRPVSRSGAGPRAVSVGADGWRIEVDGVLIDAAGALDSGGGGEDLKLSRLALFADSIGRHCARESVDWRLVAALIEEESGFDPDAMSPAGAFGLMQVKEAAAREVGVYPFDDADSNVRAGVRYLAAMREAFPAPTRRDRHALMLAAYNMGPGHLRDAQKLAVEFGYPAQIWGAGLAATVVLLEQPVVHRRTVHGYAQGANVIRYVDRVLARYAAYRRRFPLVDMPSVAMIADISSR